MGEADAPHAQLVEGSEKVDVRAERLDPFHREEECRSGLRHARHRSRRIAADGESRIVRNLLVEERELVDRYAKRKLRQVAVIEEDRGADEPDPAVVELLPELASEDADPFVPIHTLLVEVEKQVEMEIDDVVVDAPHPSIEFLERRCHHRSSWRMSRQGDVCPRRRAEASGAGPGSRHHVVSPEAATGDRFRAALYSRGRGFGLSPPI